MEKMPSVTFNGAMFNPDTGIAFADFDAPDLQTVEEFCKIINSPPYDKIVEVQPLEL